MSTHNKQTDVARRTFLRTGAASAVFLGSGFWTADALRAGQVAENIRGEARNIIFLVSDGMSNGTLTLADVMLRRRDGRSSHWMKLYERPDIRRGLMDMASLDSIVTDSSAASSSWGCGHRINNGGVNWGPDDRQYTPILKYFRDAGKGTGLVTTTTITHATPAGFGANVPQRGMQEKIAEQYLERRYDVLLGGGNQFYDKNLRSDGHNLYADYLNAGYHVVAKKQDLFNVPNDDKQLLGLFFDGHVPYTLDHINTKEYRENIPTLAEMTQIALNRLSRNRNGFIMQVEGGRIDHAAHGNDVGGLLYDQIAFDDAIGVAVEFAGEHPDTLVIVTTDHGNANPGLNGEGSGYRDSNMNFDRIQNFRYTNDWILRGLNEESTVPGIRARVKEATGIEISGKEAATLQDSYRGTYEAVYSMMNRPWAVMGQILANYTSVNWIGTAHTADYVELAAFGPGSEAIGAFMKNTQLFGVMTQAAGVEVARK
jgi:alkaline phosphatase